MACANARLSPAAPLRSSASLRQIPGFVMPGAGIGIKSPPFCEGGACLAARRGFPSAPHRHSGAGRNPEPRLAPACRIRPGVDSRFRGNDGGVVRRHMALVERGRFSLSPTLSRWERAFEGLWRCADALHS